MNSFKINSLLLSFILFEFIFLTSSSFCLQKIPTSKELEAYAPSLTLIGVIVSKDPSSSTAVLKNEKTGRIIMLKVGESIYDYKLIHVYENRITLQKDERTFQIFMGKSNLVRADRPSVKKPDKIRVIDQKEDILKTNQLRNYLTKKEFIRSEVLKRVEKEWPLIMKETRFVPNITDGRISGFKITNLPKETILSEIGIINNDIIKEINGIELNDMDAIFGLYNKFKDASRFEVAIERGGKLLYLLYILR